MKKTLALLIAVAGILAGCGKLPEAELWKRAEAARGHNNADSTVQMCELILKEYPESPSAVAATYLLADVQQNLKHDYHAAINQYKYFMQKYPDSRQTPVAMFLVGFLYNNELKMGDSAKIAYQEFVAKYPSHELKSSAEFEIQSIGKTPEEIIGRDASAKKTVAMKGKK